HHLITGEHAIGTSRRVGDLASRCVRGWITHRNWRWIAPGAQIAAVLHGGEACVTISMSRAERADLGQRGAQPGAARRRTHGDERTNVPVDTAEGGQVVRLAHLLRLNPPDGRSSHIEWQLEGHRRL